MKISQITVAKLELHATTIKDHVSITCCCPVSISLSHTQKTTSKQEEATSRSKRYSRIPGTLVKMEAILPIQNENSTSGAYTQAYCIRCPYGMLGKHDWTALNSMVATDAIVQCPSSRVIQSSFLGPAKLLQHNN